MTSSKFKKILVASALVFGSTAALPPVALAQVAQDAGFYVGGSLGYAKFKDACGGIANCDDKDTAWKIFGGYQFNRNVGVEAGYTDLGEVTGTIPAPPITFKAKAKGFELLGVGTFPINEQFAVYGKAGLFRWDVDASATVAGFSAATSDKGTDLTFGLGLKYNFTKNLAARVEWQRYQDVEVDVISVGLVVKF